MAALACWCLVAVVVLAGCGGGSRQDAGEPKGTFAMKVLRASFPAEQAVSRPATLVLSVKNTGDHRVANVAVTIDSFLYTSNFPELAANQRPIWAIERGPGATAKPPVKTVEVSAPGSAQTAYVNTWALGPLAAGATQTFAWHVIPVKPGTFTVRYAVAAGLAGKAQARLSVGGPLNGEFRVLIAGAPPKMHVDPRTGRVVLGAYPSTP